MHPVQLVVSWDGSVRLGLAKSQLRAIGKGLRVRTDRLVCIYTFPV